MPYHTCAGKADASSELAPAQCCAAITIRRSELGAMEVLIDDWVCVTVNYDYRYMNNASTRLLAEAVQKLLQHGLRHNESSSARQRE